jgi:hypothetical protein
VRLLCWRQLLPHLRALLHLLPLCRAEVLPLPVVIQNALLLLRR